MGMVHHKDKVTLCQNQRLYVFKLRKRRGVEGMYCE